MKKKAVILYSGWADSTTVLYKLLEEWYEVYPLIVDYWQRNHKEIMRAFWILEELWLPHKLIVCPTINQICDSGLIWEWEFIWDKPDYTVHSRNLWLASMWAMYAQNIKADVLAFGIHDGSFDYDCSKEFWLKLDVLIWMSYAHKVRLYLPYITHSKKELLEDWIRMGVPYDKTWTCYNSWDTPCWKCPSCKTREESFSQIK